MVIIDREIIKKLSRGHIPLINWRALRPYLGGRMIDSLKGVPESLREDGYRPEEWIGSYVTASLGMKEAPNEGLSLVKLPSGITVYLKDIVEFCPLEILGKSVVDHFGSEFPVLTKFLDSAQRLPGQFHPSTEFIKSQGMGARGKKESWLILDTRWIGEEEQRWEFVSTNRFLAEKWIIKEKTEKTSNGSYRIGIVVKGNGILNSLSGKDRLKPGDFFLIPASSEKYSLQRSGVESLEIIWSLPSA